jgi:plastocyanin
MAKYISDRQRNLKIGITSYTENLTVLEVTGGAYISSYVGIGTTNPTQSLHIQGSARLTGALYDSTNVAGNSGQVLQTTGSGIIWSNASDVGILTYVDRSGIATFATNAGIATFATSAGIATYADRAGIATYADRAGIATFATSAGISTFATNAGISTFATIAGIATFATNAGISTFADRAGIATFATNAGIATFATNAGIATFATNAGISTFATNAGIATFATNAGISTFATNAGISTFATNAGISTFATIAGISTFATIAGISTFTSEWILGAVGSSDYTFTGPGFTGAESDPVLYLVRGQQYKFTNTMGAHPFRIQSTPNGSVGTQYDDGIPSNNISNGTLTWNVQFDAPGILYYQCTAHGSMGGKIYIIDAGIGPDVSVNTTGIITASSFVGNASSATFATNAGIATYADRAGIATFATNAGIATYADRAGIATFATNAGISTFATNAGVSTSVIGGIGSITGLYVSGISTLGTVLISSGIVTATIGIVTYYGDGSKLININASSITGTLDYANNSGVSTSVIGGIGSITGLYVSGISTLGTVLISSGIVTATIGIVTYYGDGSKLTGIQTSGVVSVINQDPNTPIVYPTLVNSVGVSSLGISTTKLSFIPSSGKLGLGTVTPRENLDVIGTIGIQSAGTSNRFYLQHNSSENSLDFIFV